MGYAYSTEIGENCAKAVGLSLPVSTKQAIMICAALRGKQLQQAKALLENVIAKKQAIPFMRFNRDLGHKPGIGPGRYPAKACGEVLKLLKSAEANAQFKGLSPANLIVRHISAQTGPKAMRYGRRRRQAKRTHIEVVLEEIKAKPKEKEKGKSEK